MTPTGVGRHDHLRIVRRGATRVSKPARAWIVGSHEWKPPTQRFSRGFPCHSAVNCLSRHTRHPRIRHHMPRSIDRHRGIPLVVISSDFNVTFSVFAPPSRGGGILKLQTDGHPDRLPPIPFATHSRNIHRSEKKSRTCIRAIRLNRRVGSTGHLSQACSVRVEIDRKNRRNTVILDPSCGRNVSIIKFRHDHLTCWRLSRAIRSKPASSGVQKILCDHDRLSRQFTH